MALTGSRRLRSTRIFAGSPLPLSAVLRALPHLLRATALLGGRGKTLDSSVNFGHDPDLLDLDDENNPTEEEK